MGVEETWRQRLPRRRFSLLRTGDDRRSQPLQRSRLLLAAGGGLALLAMLLARTLPGSNAPAARPAIRTVAVVVAASDIGFGQALTPDRLKLAEVPANALPAGSFERLEQLTGGRGRAALRPIAANEIITASALATGASRLSAAPLLAPGRRALALPVDDVTGVSGLVFPGDRVDVLMTRTPEEAMPHAELVAQDLRVLAVGEDMNIARSQPGAVKSVTLEVSPAQAQKLTLAVAAGRLSLALRHFGDDGRIRLESLQVMDLNDGTGTRLVRKPVLR